MDGGGILQDVLQIMSFISAFHLMYTVSNYVDLQTTSSFLHFILSSNVSWFSICLILFPLSFMPYFNEIPNMEA